MYYKFPSHFLFPLLKHPHLNGCQTALRTGKYIATISGTFSLNIFPLISLSFSWSSGYTNVCLCFSITHYVYGRWELRCTVRCSQGTIPVGRLKDNGRKDNVYSRCAIALSLCPLSVSRTITIPCGFGAIEGKKIPILVESVAHRRLARLPWWSTWWDGIFYRALHTTEKECIFRDHLTL